MSAPKGLYVGWLDEHGVWQVREVDPREWRERTIIVTVGGVSVEMRVAQRVKP